MPNARDLPANTAQWAVDPDRAVLLVHDMQRYFVRPLAAVETPATDLVRNIALLRERCAEMGVPVAYTAQPGDMTEVERGLLQDFWGPGMRIDPVDRQIVEPLGPADDDWMFTKWRYSAFFQSDLLETMSEHHRDQLVLCGVYAHVGVLQTAVEAFSNDIQPFLVADAVADFSARYHRLAVDYAAERCAVVTTCADILATMARRETA
jgi:isochorismate hydrolase